jgi:UDP-perosamine 4-acetyltransferase
MKGMIFLGVEVLGGEEQLASLLVSGVHTAIIGVGGIGDNTARERVFIKTAASGFRIEGVVHPSAVISPYATVDPTAQILAGAYIGPVSSVARGAIINTGAIVEHDCRIGEFAHLASGAVLGGGVSIGHHAHLGSGAIVRQSLVVGDSAIIGAGAVVTKNVPPEEVVIGVPAKRLVKRN